MSNLERMYNKTIEEPPGEYTVVVRSAPIRPYNKRVWTRVGNFHTLEDAKLGIKRDLESCLNTMSGLFDPTPTEGREYAIWKATWERVQ